MTITQEEKEALFEEFESRMKHKPGAHSGYETLHNLERAKDRFWERYHAMIETYEFKVWSPYGIVSADWDKIRQLVCHAYGVSIVKRIPDDKLDEANDLAINLIDILFDRNTKLLEEKKNDV